MELPEEDAEDGVLLGLRKFCGHGGQPCGGAFRVIAGEVVNGGGEGFRRFGDGSRAGGFGEEFAGEEGGRDFEELLDQGIGERGICGEGFREALAGGLRALPGEAHGVQCAGPCAARGWRRADHESFADGNLHAGRIRAAGVRRGPWGGHWSLRGRKGNGLLPGRQSHCQHEQGEQRECRDGPDGSGNVRGGHGGSLRGKRDRYREAA